MNDIDTRMLEQHNLRPTRIDGPVGIDEQE